MIRMFHAVSLEPGVEMAKVLAFSAAGLRAGVERVEKAQLELTAVIEPAASWARRMKSRSDWRCIASVWRRWRSTRSGADHLGHGAGGGDGAAGAAGVKAVEDLTWEMKTKRALASAATRR